MSIRIGSRRFWRAAAAVLIAGAAARALMPVALEFAIERILGRSPGYGGSVEDVDLALAAGRLAVEGLEVRKESDKKEAPLLRVERAEGAIRWSELLRGRLAVEAKVTRPDVQYSVEPGPKKPKEPVEPEEAARTLSETLQGLPRFWISRLLIEDGRARVRDDTRAPAVDLTAKDVRVELRNFTNSEVFTGTTTAAVSVRAALPGSADFKLDMEMRPLEKEPTFDVNTSLTGAQVKAYNDVLRRLDAGDVQAGRMDVYAEVTAGNGLFKGYVKPLVQGLDVHRPEEKTKGLGQAIKEIAADAAANLLRNRRKDSIGTRVPFQGRLEYPRVRVWESVGSSLRHAFVKSITPGVSGSITLKNGKPR
jgi:hypothetical protein